MRRFHPQCVSNPPSHVTQIDVAPGFQYGRRLTCSSSSFQEWSVALSLKLRSTTLPTASLWHTCMCKYLPCRSSCHMLGSVILGSHDLITWKSLCVINILFDTDSVKRWYCSSFHANHYLYNRGLFWFTLITVF